MTITMYDSVDVSQIPAKAEAVAGYVGGKWPTFAGLAKKFPKAHRVSIAVNASEDAECLDIEPGDATVSEAPAWFKRQKARKVARPIFYTSLSNVDALVSTLNAAGIKRGEYRIWSAHYTGTPHICGPHEGIDTNADATQYYDKALGRNLDVSLCDDSFFGSPTPSTFVPADELRWEREWDQLVGKKSPWAHLRRVVLKRYMVRRERLIVNLAHKSGWNTLNRLDRYRKLFARTQTR